MVTEINSTEDVNLELRRKILEKALFLEAQVNDILLFILSIDREDRKALAT